MDIASFQKKIGDIYVDRDGRRGIWGTYAWFIEEVGELARALRTGEDTSLREEFADVFAWLASLANLCGIDLAKAAGKYSAGCPKCLRTPCACPE